MGVLVETLALLAPGCPESFALLATAAGSPPPLAAQGIRLNPLLGGVLLLLLIGVLLYARWLRDSHRQLSWKLRTELAHRKRSDEALQKSEVFYHSLVETLPQSILRKDMEGRFTFANSRFCAELGRSLEQILGRTDFDFFPATLAEKYREDDRRVLASGQVLDVVEEHVTPGGEKLYVQVMKIPVRGPDGAPIGIQGIFWDVTARKRAEQQLQERNRMLQTMAESERQAHEALKQAQGQLIQSEKLASLGQMVAGVAHEINNPLAFVSNNVAVLGRDLGDFKHLIEMYQDVLVRQGDELRDDAARIREFRERCDLDYAIENLPGILSRTREGLRRIQRIVSDLRLFARIDESEISQVDLNAGIESSITIIEGVAKKRGIKLVRELQPLPPIRCFAAKINQVVVNLLSNAIDASPNDAVIHVRTRAEQDWTVIEVEDHGCGIDPHIRNQIFDPFFTTKPIGQGTGLGLSISYGIVQEHGGRIEVDSTPEQGTCFRVMLPNPSDAEVDPD